MTDNRNFSLFERLSAGLQIPGHSALDDQLQNDHRDPGDNLQNANDTVIVIEREQKNTCPKHNQNIHTRLCPAFGKHEYCLCGSRSHVSIGGIHRCCERCDGQSEFKNCRQPEHHGFFCSIFLVLHYICVLFGLRTITLPSKVVRLHPYLLPFLPSYTYARRNNHVVSTAKGVCKCGRVGFATGDDVHCCPSCSGSNDISTHSRWCNVNYVARETRPAFVYQNVPFILNRTLVMQKSHSLDLISKLTPEEARVSGCPYYHKKGKNYSLDLSRLPNFITTLLLFLYPTESQAFSVSDVNCTKVVTVKSNDCNVDILESVYRVPFEDKFSCLKLGDETIVTYNDTTVFSLDHIDTVYMCYPCTSDVKSKLDECMKKHSITFSTNKPNLDRPVYECDSVKTCFSEHLIHGHDIIVKSSTLYDALQEKVKKIKVFKKTTVYLESESLYHTFFGYFSSEEVSVEKRKYFGPIMKYGFIIGVATSISYKGDRVFVTASHVLEDYKGAQWCVDNECFDVTGVSSLVSDADEDIIAIKVQGEPKLGTLDVTSISGNCIAYSFDQSGSVFSESVNIKHHKGQIGAMIDGGWVKGMSGGPLICDGKFAAVIYGYNSRWLSFGSGQELIFTPILESVAKVDL